ncbi:hypothetical protein CBR_g50090 [Chara braunii]|uniref:Uncharacterized protein n=1 Tax=Chara braunii TaxID=69332 RepID=A0A388M5Y5_CHABU|nr:hypothetical protein CBR_g50090 [Chara braunii]|eukprot:GBG89998.1 hypothetical protein CBR_g50090 [Chara braunii]
MESNTIEWNAIELIMIESNTIESNTIESSTIESNKIESNAIESVIIESDMIESNMMSLDSRSSRTRSSWPVTLMPNEIVLTTGTITIELNTIADASSRRRCCLITIWNFSAPRAMPTLCDLLIFCFAVMCSFELTMVLNGRGERIPNIKHVALRWAKHAGFGKLLVDVFNPPETLEVKLPNLVDVVGFFDSNVIAGREPVVHPADRISEPKRVLSRTVETGPSITIHDTPPGPKVGQIGEKGPCRGLVEPSAPMKTRPTTTKTPVALGSRSRYDVATKGHLPLVGQQRYDYTVPGRVEEVHEYFEDEDEENNEEYSERAGGQEQYAAGVGGMTRHPGETSKVVGQDEDSEHTVSTSGGEVGPAGGYGSNYELYEGDVHATVAVAGHTDAAGLAERKRKHRRERKSLMDNKRSSVILTPKRSGAAERAGKHSTKTYVEMVKIERTMLRMFHYFVFISDPHRKSSEWTEPFFNNLSDLFDKYSDEGLTSERWIDQRRHFKEMSWVRMFPATLGGEEEKVEEGFKKSASLAAKCPEEFVQFVNKLLRILETRERRPKMLADVVEKNFTPTKLKMVGMERREKLVYEGMEREPNAMVETLEHFCPADEAVVFLGKGHAALIWELLKSHRYCIVLEGEGMKFEFLIQFVTKMIKSGLYLAKFVKPPPRHDEKRDLVYKVGKNIVNIWEFLFETKPENRGERTYVVRRRKMESLLRGYHKAPAETEVAFLHLLRLNPKVSQSRLNARTEEIFEEFKTSRWLEYLEEFYDRETSPTFGYNWRIEEELEDQVGERKGASGDESGKGSGSGGGALGKGTRSSGGEHGKGLGPSVGASGKPISHGELQKHEMCQGRQATEGKVSGPSDGRHDKGSGSPLGLGPSNGAHCRGSGSPMGLGPSSSAHGRGSRGDASGQDLGGSGGESVKGVSHGELPKCVEDVLPDDQVWVTTVLVSKTVTAQVDNTCALAELEMSLDMPAEKDEHEVSLDMKNESTTAGANETANVQAIEEDEGHIVLSTREQHTLV